MLFIFDWDGTLSDSTGKIIKCMQQAAQRAGLPERDELEIKNIIGLGMKEALTELYPAVSDEKLQEVRQAYSEIYAHEDRVPSPFYPGVEETLHRLRDDGFTLTVATGKSRRGLDRVLNTLGMSRFFHGSRCADETASKPDPRMLKELLEHFKYQPELAVMVGDTEYDMDMAERAGVPRVAVSYGAHEASRLTQYSPILSIHLFPQLLAILEDKQST